MMSRVAWMYMLLPLGPLLGANGLTLSTAEFVAPLPTGAALLLGSSIGYGTCFGISKFCKRNFLTSLHRGTITCWCILVLPGSAAPCGALTVFPTRSACALPSCGDTLRPLNAGGSLGVTIIGTRATLTLLRCL
jgi:hypothetical protein